jgi:formylglycine-generating enzyme required for sulfatase activity
MSNGKLLEALLFALLLTGCGGGGGTDLRESAESTTATYQIIDLSAGSVTAAASVPDLHTNPKYQTSHMVFRLMPQGTAIIGAAETSFAHQIDESQSQVSMPRYYMAVFEITQAQWQTIAGSEPWTLLQWSEGSTPIDDVGDSLPAYGLSHDLVSAALSDWRLRTGKDLRLPSDAQWEYACRAGATGIYAWGDSRNTVQVGQYATVFETQTDPAGPRPVGERQANAWGLYDMHGNCWEVTSDSNLRGGSWYDPVSLARAANKHTIDSDTAHALVGVRLLYLP